MNLEKLLKFLMPLVLIAIATAALFLGLAGFTEWSVACGSLLGVWLGQKGYLAIKAAKAKKNEVA